MPMKKAKAGGKTSNRGKYYGGGMMSKPRTKKGHGGVMVIKIQKDKKRKNNLKWDYYLHLPGLEKRVKILKVV